MIAAPELASAKPYLLRAMYDWCCDHGFTPYATVFVDETVQVPMDFVKDHAITLNIGADATGDFLLSHESLQFKARFGGVPRQIVVPTTHIMAIFARENGQGMAFPISDASVAMPADTGDSAEEITPDKILEAAPTPAKKEVSKPILTRVK
jgi:stringent starvation protein B